MTKQSSSGEVKQSDLTGESGPHITGPVTKNRLMTYTFIALVILELVSIVMWWPVTEEGWSLGVTSAIGAVIAVLVAVALDYLLSLVMKSKGPLNTISAAVFGMIVALSYTLGIPAMATKEGQLLPLIAPGSFVYVAVISAVGLIVFKKLQGFLGRKYVNPAATAKLVVLLPFVYQILLPADHSSFIPSLAKGLGYTVYYNGQPSALGSFASFMQYCFGNPSVVGASTFNSFQPSDVFQTLFLAKFHGWVGGASSLAVIVVGVGFFIVARKYVKWRITLSYLVTVTLMALVLTGIYGAVAGDSFEQAALLRIMFELFIGSSIFLAFFMATDPASTPLTGLGQGIFGVGLGVLTVLIQTYMNFFGGSILALIIMNLTVPLLDRVGIHKPFGR
jgi:electron transport complex protein RnfD